MTDTIDTGWKIPLSFYFQVNIGTDEIAFKEVSGLSAEMELETIQEGGVNEYEHRLPKQIKHGNLVLKRALMPITNNNVVKWISEILEKGSFYNIEGRTFPLTRTIQITLLYVESVDIQEKGKVIRTESRTTPVNKWECTNAFPVKWEVDALDSEKSSVLIESIEFAYATLKCMD
ncbi:phage tail protein [Dysgonomonas sp. 25]|uniref:phage tail protein n=1 Tax=Dysgonomonas sp. 25 TaxID=2302933 RepID=UPI0013D0865B|nr:phage tail protein [Dysgonomonas sp. 25]NDV67375.1 hypothetical protein [Dysgonomonas sp. 25]